MIAQLIFPLSPPTQSPQSTAEQKAGNAHLLL